MLFINNNEVLYSVELNGDGTCDMYNFRTMYHNSTANLALLQVEFPPVGAVEGQLIAPFVLVLDFYSNIRNQHINNLIERVKSFFEKREMRSQITESPLRITVVGIEINDVCMMIDLEEFQTLCKELTSMSAWHLFGTLSFS